MLSRFVKRHSGFTRRFAVVIPEMVLVTMVMDVVPVTCTNIRATILSMSSISLDKLVIIDLYDLQSLQQRVARQHDIVDSFLSGKLQGRGAGQG
jgi:hypothetical protein